MGSLRSDSGRVAAERQATATYLRTQPVGSGRIDAVDGRPRPAMVRHLPSATLIEGLGFEGRELRAGIFRRRGLMDSTDRQVNRSPGISALENLYLAPWALYDLAIFGVPLI